MLMKTNQSSIVEINRSWRMWFMKNIMKLVYLTIYEFDNLKNKT